MSEPTKFEKVVAHMIELRDQLDEKKREYEEAIKPIKDRIAKGNAWLLDQINAAGVSSMKCSSGTVYISETLSVSAPDKAAFTNFIRQTGEIELLELRPSKAAIKEYMDRNNGELPPGIATRTERNLNLRRPSGK